MIGFNLNVVIALVFLFMLEARIFKIYIFIFIDLYIA